MIDVAAMLGESWPPPSSPFIYACRPRAIAAPSMPPRRRYAYRRLQVPFAPHVVPILPPAHATVEHYVYVLNEFSRRPRDDKAEESRYAQWRQKATYCLSASFRQEDRRKIEKIAARYNTQLVPHTGWLRQRSAEKRSHARKSPCCLKSSRSPKSRLRHALAQRCQSRRMGRL